MASAVGTATLEGEVSGKFALHFRQTCKTVEVSEDGTQFERSAEDWLSIRVGESLDISEALKKTDECIKFSFEIVKGATKDGNIFVSAGITTEGVIETCSLHLINAVPCVCYYGNNGYWYCNGKPGKHRCPRFAIGNTITLAIGNGDITLFIDGFEISKMEHSHIEMLLAVKKPLYFAVAIHGRGTAVRITE